MPDYFAECGNAEAVKNQYRTLAKEFHPDLHSSIERETFTQIMQDINAQYAYTMQRMIRREKPSATAAEHASMDSVNEAIRRAVETIISLDGLNVEICGLWVWVSGNTKTHKDALKAAGYRWAPKKEQWYFAGVPAGGRGRYSMDDIRSRYGSQRVTRDEDKTTRQRRPAAALA